MSKRTIVRELPSQADLLRMFVYDPATGDLRWRNSQGSVGAGALAGTTSTGRKPYLRVGTGQGYFFAHRIIWKMMTGADPTDMIDHIDGDVRNNRWINLREADNGKNKQNSAIYRNNRTGVKGVHFKASHNRFIATIGVAGRQIRLGCFKTLEEAALVRAKAAADLHAEFGRAA